MTLHNGKKLLQYNAHNRTSGVGRCLLLKGHNDERADYFAAGTEVVWDVDIQSKDVVRVYRSSAPDVPMTYRRGEMAEAEPAVPGWSMSVDDLFL